MLKVPPSNINIEILNNLQSSREESITFCIMYYKGQGSWLIHFKRVFNNTFWNQSVSCLSHLKWKIIYHNIPFYLLCDLLSKNFGVYGKKSKILKEHCGMCQINLRLNLFSDDQADHHGKAVKENLKERLCAQNFYFPIIQVCSLKNPTEFNTYSRGSKEWYREPHLHLHHKN